VESYHATLCVASSVKITGQPSNIFGGINPGQTASFSVSATANPGPLTYQWYSRRKGGAYSAIVGAETRAYTTPPVTTQDDDSGYFVRISCGTTTVESYHATLYVGQFLTITRQPENVTGAELGGSATFSVTTNTNPGNATYQWYSVTSVGLETAIAGATSNTYSTPPLSEQDDESNYFVRASCGSANITSRSASLKLASYRTWKSPTHLAALANSEIPGTPPVLEINPRGDRMAIWSVTTVDGTGLTGSKIRTYATHQPKDGVWSAPSVLFETPATAPSRHPGEHRLACDSDGNWWALWSCLDSDDHTYKGSIQIACFSAAEGTWSAAKSVESPGMMISGASVPPSSALSLKAPYRGGLVASWVSRPDSTGASGSTLWVANFSTLDQFLPVNASQSCMPNYEYTILGMEAGMDSASLSPFVVLAYTVYAPMYGSSNYTTWYAIWDRNNGWSSPQNLPEIAPSNEMMSLQVNDLGRVGFVGMGTTANSVPYVWRKQCVYLGSCGASWQDLSSMEIPGMNAIRGSVQIVMADSSMGWVAWLSKADEGRVVRVAALSGNGSTASIQSVGNGHPNNTFQIKYTLSGESIIFEKGSDAAGITTSAFLSAAGFWSPSSLLTGVTGVSMPQITPSLLDGGDALFVFLDTNSGCGLGSGKGCIHLVEYQR